MDIIIHIVVKRRSDMEGNIEMLDLRKQPMNKEINTQLKDIRKKSLMDMGITIDRIAKKILIVNNPKRLIKLMRER